MTTPLNIIQPEFLDSLGSRVTPVASDLVPVLPVGATTLQNITLGGLQGFVLTSVSGFGTVDPTGVADSTTAFQAAINSGKSFYIPPGTYKISRNLYLNTVASQGQIITGAGCTDSTGLGTGKTILRPTANVTKLFSITGQPFNGYVQSFGFSNFTIDMTNMADVSTNAAFMQVYAFDGFYNNIRVINYGIKNVSWQFNTASYTTQMTSCCGRAVRFNGTALYNAVTTITLTNCDILSIGGSYHVGITMIGGAVQQPFTSQIPIVYIPPGTTPYAYSPNLGGLYVAEVVVLQNCISFSSFGTDWENGGGYPTTYNDGIHGTLPLIVVFSVSATSQNASFVSPSFFGMYLLDSGTSTSISGQGIGASFGGDISSRPDYKLGSLNVMNSIYGFTDLSNYLDYDNTITFSISSQTGAANFQTTVIQPSTDNVSAFLLKTAAGNQVLDISTLGGIGSVNLNNRTDIVGYTDNGTTVTWSVDGYGALICNAATINGTTVIRPQVNGNTLLIETAAGQAFVVAATNSTPANSILEIGLGASIGLFTDSYSTQSIGLNGATGAITSNSVSAVGTISANTVNVAGTITAGTISATSLSGTFSSFLLKPAVDGNAFVLEDAAAQAIVIIATNSTPSNSVLGIGRGANLTLYSDAYSTQSINLNGTSGSISAASAAFTPQADNTISLSVYNHESTLQFGFYSTATSTNAFAFLNNGASINGYSDSVTTQTWGINSSTGQGKFGSQLYAGAGNSGSPTISTACGILQGNGVPSNSLGNNGDVYFQGNGVATNQTIFWHKESGSWIQITGPSNIWTNVSSNAALIANHKYAANSVGGTFTLTLPLANSVTINSSIIVGDVGGKANVNNIIVVVGSSNDTLNNVLYGEWIINVSNIKTEFISSGNGWGVVQ